jgi:transposase
MVAGRGEGDGLAGGAPLRAGLRYAGPCSMVARTPEPVQDRDMKDFQLYQQILNLVEPWRVEGVELKIEEKEVEVRICCAETAWGCPQCGQRMHLHGSEERRWRHLDSCQFKTILVAEVPRVECPTHGTQMVAVPWAEKFSRLSKLFERFAIDVMLECSIEAASKLLRISWDEADGVKQRSVARGLTRKPKQVPEKLCVDEKSFARGQQYVTVVAGVKDGQTTVEYVGVGRKQESLDAYWRQFNLEELGGVKAVAMDMWDPYFQSTLAWVPEAAKKIAHDPFHLVKHMNEAVNDVRKIEHQILMAAGDDILKGTRQLWLYGMENVPPEKGRSFEVLQKLNLKTSRAWGIKEVFRSFWLCKTVAKARDYFQGWYDWAIRSRLGPVKKVARMFKKHLPNILTYFEHRLTNGPMEGLNNKIQGLIKKAFGYRNQERFITDIFFHCGGLDLYPAQ